MGSEVSHRLWLPGADGSALEEVSGTFSAEELSRLSSFDREVDRLAATVLMREGGPLSMHIGANGDVTARLPVRSAVAEFLLQLRPFILNDELTSFNRVANILRRRIVSERFRALVDELKEIFSGDRFHRQFQIRAAGNEVNTEETLKKWLNAYEYHRDEEQQRAVEALFPALPKEACEAVFLALLRDKATAIINLGDWIGRLLR